MVIDKLLLVNLKRYPQDRRSIYVTFKHLGANHPDLTLPLITSLLKIHPYFDKQVIQSSVQVYRQCTQNRFCRRRTLRTPPTSAN